MDIKTYLTEANRTMSHQWHIHERHYELLHCAIGMVTEFGELLQATANTVSMDKVNVMEEVGDVFWYMAGFQRVSHDLVWEDVEPTGYTNVTTMINAATIEAIEILDAFKKWAFYGKQPTDDMLKIKLYFIYRCCQDILKAVGYTPQEARQINIDKLRKRFPTKFTSDDAINRDLDTERKTLEGQA